MTFISMVLTAITVAGAVAAMTRRNLVHAVLALVVAFLGLATLYLSLGAQFVGFAQVLVYVGAVSILAVFAILLTRGASSEADATPASKWFGGLAIAAGTFGLLARAIAASRVGRAAVDAPPQATVKQIGNALMGAYVLPLEIVGLLLTAALIGAVMIAADDRKVTR